MDQRTALRPHLDRETVLSRLDDADRLSLAEVAQNLVEWVGLGLTAMAGGVNETRFVRSWTAGKRARRPASLRAAWRAAYVITTLCGSEAAKAWFIGQKREFDFEPPIRVLQENTDDARTAVVRAAVRFATS